MTGKKEAKQEINKKKNSSPKTMKDILLKLIDFIDGMDSEDGLVKINRVNPKRVRIDLIWKKDR